MIPVLIKIIMIVQSNHQLCFCVVHPQLNLPLVNRFPAGVDPAASALSQPPIIGNVDPSKIDEIRRTVYVGNLNSQVT